MGPARELSDEDPLGSIDISSLYLVGGVVVGLSQVVILIALVFGCHACYRRRRRYRHKGRGHRIDTISEDSKDETNGQGQAQPIFMDASSASPGAPGEKGTYGAVVQGGPFIMNMGTAPYTPSAPSTSFAAGAPQYWHQPQQPFVPQEKQEEMPPAYNTVFPEKKS